MTGKKMKATDRIELARLVLSLVEGSLLFLVQ